MPSGEYLQRLWNAIKQALDGKADGEGLTSDEVQGLLRTARAQHAGTASGAARAPQTSSPALTTPAASGVISLAAVSAAPWDGSPSRFSSTADYCDSCLINTNTGPRDQWTQDNCHLPVREPNGDLNANAVRAAEGRIDQVQAPAADKAKAKRALEGLARQAGFRTNMTDAEFDREFVVSLRNGDAVPVWQQLHRIGEWAIPHRAYGKISFTKEDGDSWIRNFNAGVTRQPIPLDANHLTGNGGESLAWLEELRWGQEGEGLSGFPDPSGQGPIMYGRWRYTPEGLAKLSGEAWKGISPSYHRDYVDDETGQRYGPTLLQVAATNSPFLRLRTLQGEPAPEPVLLDDGLRRPATGGIMPENQNPTTTPTTEPAAAGVEGATALTAGVPSSSPDPQVAQALVQLAAERSKNQAAEARIIALERVNREREVENIVQLSISAGTPPVIANKLGAIMLACAPNDTAVIRLSNDASAQPVTLYTALQDLLNTIPRVRLGSIALGAAEDMRPPNESRTELDAAYDEITKEQIRLAGGVLAASSTNGNGGASA